MPGRLPFSLGATAKPPAEPAAADGSRAGILNDEGETIGAFAQSAGFSELKLKRGLKAGSDGLFVVKPSRAGPAFSGWRQAQRVADDSGVAHQFQAFGGREVREADGGLRRHRCYEQEKCGKIEAAQKMKLRSAADCAGILDQKNALAGV